MPVRKPRRDPRAHAEGFEALYYPFLVDLIFAYAPCASLRVLRGVCKFWKQRADRLSVRHVLVFNSSLPRWSLTPLAPTATDGPIPRLYWHKTNLVTHVKFVDFHGRFQGHILDNVAWTLSDWPHWMKKASRVETIRHQLTPYEAVSTLRVAPTTPNSGTVADRFARPQTVLALPAEIAETPAHCIPKLSCSGDPPSSLRVIVGGLPTTGLHANANHFYGGVFNFLIKFVACHLQQTHARNVTSPLTLVNLDSWYDHLIYKPGPRGRRTPTFSRRRARQKVARVCKNDGKFRELLLSKMSARVSPDVAAQLIETVTFVSLEQYRAEVGAEQLQFEIEMCGVGKMGM